MKLRREKLIPPNRRSEAPPICGARRDNRGIGRFWVIAMNEISITAVRNPSKQRTISPDDFELIPANLRNLQPVLASEPDYFAGKNPQTSGATIKLLTLFEEGL